MRLNRTAFVLALVSMILLTTSIARADGPDAGSFQILNGSELVQALNASAWTVKADLDFMADPTITGHVTVRGGADNEIQVLVLSESGFTRWKNNEIVTPIYDSGHVTAADVSARLSESGTYYVVLSNAFSASSPKTVEATLKMTWQPSASVIAAREKARKVRNVKIVAVLGGFVVCGASYAGSVAIRRARQKYGTHYEKIKRAA